MGRDGVRAFGLVCIMMLAPLSGCFGEGDDDGPIRQSDVVVTPEVLIGGVFQGVTISADRESFSVRSLLDDERRYWVCSKFNGC